MPRMQTIFHRLNSISTPLHFDGLKVERTRFEKFGDFSIRRCLRFAASPVARRRKGAEIKENREGKINESFVEAGQ